MALNQDAVGAAQGATGPTQDPNKGHLVVRIDQDSESDLQELFDSVLKPDAKRPLQIPLRMRKLPDSFFNPPSTGSKSPSVSHSRDGSADSAFGVAQQPLNGAASPVPGATGPQMHPGLPVVHQRAQSSPASLQETYASAQQQRQMAPQPQPVHRVHHQKQRSYDVLSTIDDLGPLPHGWEQARTPEGQIYYLK